MGQEVGKEAIALLYHWSTPTTSLPQEHSEFIEDPQVNFTSTHYSSSHRTLNVPSTVHIIDLEDDNPMTDEETTMTETKDEVASLPCLQAASLSCLHAASLPCSVPAVNSK